MAQQREIEAQKIHKERENAWARADITLMASRF